MAIEIDLRNRPDIIELVNQIGLKRWGTKPTGDDIIEISGYTERCLLELMDSTGATAEEIISTAARRALGMRTCYRRKPRSGKRTSGREQ